MCSGIRVPCGLTDRHDIPTVAFRNFANAPKKLRKWSWFFYAPICVPVVMLRGSGTCCLISAFTGVVTDTICYCVGLHLYVRFLS